jgi:hypothetical protein
MTSLSRRLELEASYQVAIRQAGEHARNLESAIRKRVLEHLSLDELRALRDVASARQQGSFTEEGLTADHRAALEKYNATFDEECRNAGFASTEDFYRRIKAG